MIHNENNHSAGETKATDDAATATATAVTARVCFQQLPRHLRLQIFHCLTYRNYLLVSPTCTMAWPGTSPVHRRINNCTFS